MKSPAKLESARQKRNRRRARREARITARVRRIIEQGAGPPPKELDDEHFVAFTHPSLEADLRASMATGEIGTVENVRFFGTRTK